MPVEATAATSPARVVAVRDNLVTIEVPEAPIMKNEVAFICVQGPDGGDQRLKAEVLRIHGRQADIQVFEDTSGVKIGDPVDLSGELLSVSLGPGLLDRSSTACRTHWRSSPIDTASFFPGAKTWTASMGNENGRSLPAPKWAIECLPGESWQPCRRPLRA